jgi:N6-adenosine-specific RNA methylase IME4
MSETSPEASMASPSAEARALDALRPHERADLVPAMDERAFAEFRADIARRGLQEPIEITADGKVLDGHARLRAASELEFTTISVRVVDPDDEVDHIILAALQRRHLTASQRAALAVELDRYRQQREQARERSLANLHPNPEKATLPPQGQTRDRAAAWAGVSPRTVQDAATVREHDPELFEQVKAGGIAADQAARRVRRRLRDASLPTPPPPPEGPFELIYADPPWQLGHADSRYAPENHYPCMPLEEIKAISIPAADSAILFLWAVNQLLPEALEVLETWGFDYVANLAWVKPSIGLGVWTRNRHELLLVGRRSKVSPPEPDERPDSVIEAARGRHSAKPDSVYTLIETAYPQLSKLELFHRGKPRPGWTMWGNQADSPEDPSTTDTVAQAA